MKEQNERYRKLLEDTLSLFNTMGVIEGKGRDGELMHRINSELTGSSVITIDTSLPNGSCPICGNRNMLNCDCSPEDQMAAMS